MRGARIKPPTVPSALAIAAGIPYQEAYDRGVPTEVWSPSKGKFVPYKDAGKPRDVSWGTVIGDADAKDMMGDDASADHARDAAE